jgi:hypothetical protein
MGFGFKAPLEMPRLRFARKRSAVGSWVRPPTEPAGDETEHSLSRFPLRLYSGVGAGDGAA